MSLLDVLEEVWGKRSSIEKIFYLKRWQQIHEEVKE